VTEGYGDSGWVPHTFFLQYGHKFDVGIFKLFLSGKQVDLSHVAQSSPFVPIGGPSRSATPSLSFDSDSSRGTVQTVMPLMGSKGKGSETTVLQTLPLPWDTIEIPVVRALADKRDGDGRDKR
jgi:hypothetical protein